MLPNFTVCFVSGRRLLYPREVCGMARYLQPTMLVFEDIDLIAQERDMNGLATVLGELMNQIDGCEPNEQVLFVMNTNSMDRIEQAVKNRPGRIDQIIHIPLPDQADRARLLRLFSARFAPSAEEIDRVAAATDGATPAMLKEIVKRAAVSAVARADGKLVPRPHGGNGDGQADRNGDGTASTELAITAQDLLLAYEQVQHLRNLKSPVTQIL
jgi:SpoVK/Ycf46/Vps4 family AAA+-type ATPase